MATAHQKKMQAKREARATMAAGFTPVRNARIDDAIQAATLMFQMQGLDAIEARGRALNHVARTLPAPRMSRSLRIKPSKSDSPAYRKSVVRFAKPIAAPLAEAA